MARTLFKIWEASLSLSFSLSLGDDEEDEEGEEEARGRDRDGREGDGELGYLRRRTLVGGNNNISVMIQCN